MVSWRTASRPPIKMPFRKVENCNQVIRIGGLLRFSLVNISGNDIVQGNKKLILGRQILLIMGALNTLDLEHLSLFLGFLWQLMRFNILQLLKNLRSHSTGKDISDADILNWANNKVADSGRKSRIESFKVFPVYPYFFDFFLDF